MDQYSSLVQLKFNLCEVSLILLLTKGICIQYTHINIGRLDKGASVVSLATATTAAAIFANAEDQLSNCVENPSQYN